MEILAIGGTDKAQQDTIKYGFACTCWIDDQSYYVKESISPWKR